jgi:glycosyltransferase involved in cell wall biosynthesis
MRVVITTTQVPFVRGGAEIHAENLQRALRAEGHEVEIVAIPYKWYPPERILDTILACRLLDLSESSGTTIDRVIGLKFPAYVIPHPNKVLWILHQHRTAYELWDHVDLGDMIRYPNGAQIREAIQLADKQFIPEARAVFANSGNVAQRLRNACGIASTPLYHPPQNAERFYCAESDDYLYYPSRINPMKRQALVLEALAQTCQPVQVRFSGTADHAPYLDELKALAAKLGVQHRVTWLGQVGEDEKLRAYAHALGVIYPPVDEDFGYVTLEAMLSAKPLVTCADSGGPLEFVQDGETGFVAAPAPDALAEAMDRLWAQPTTAAAMGAAARERYDGMNITWPHVVERLLA